MIIPTPYGNEMGICQGLTTNMDEISYQDDILEIVRIANDKDKAKYSENIKKESKAFTIAIEKIKQHRRNKLIMYIIFSKIIKSYLISLPMDALTLEN